MTLEYLHRGRFVALPGAVARRVRANAFTVTVPVTDEVRRVLRRDVTPEAFDGSTWSIDGVESVSALGSGGTDRAVTVTVLLP